MWKLVGWVYRSTVQRHVEFGRQLTRNSKVIGKGFSRGLPWNRRRNAPISADMSAQDVENLDQRWKSLTPRERLEAWDAHDRDVLSSMEAQGKTSGGVWSLSKSPDERRKALNRQAPWYWGWTLIMLVSLGYVAWANLATEVSLVFRLGHIAFLLILAPEFLRHRIIRAQLMHGGKVGLRQLFSPLPSAPLNMNQRGE